MRCLSWISLAVILIGLCSGCSRDTTGQPAGSSTPPPQTYGSGYGAYGDYVDESLIKFKDDVSPNASLDSDLTLLTFTNKEGQQTALRDLLGQKHLILVITRGYAGSICPYCATQTSRLIANYDKLKAENAEVVIVYPLAKPEDQPQLDAFVARAVASLPAASQKVPFPLLLDVELKAVDALGIRKDLSKPATYIFDKAGQLRFAYVGSSLADRPSVKALLEQLGKMNKVQAG